MQPKREFTRDRSRMKQGSCAFVRSQRRRPCRSRPNYSMTRIVFAITTLGIACSFVPTAVVHGLLLPSTRLMTSSPLSAQSAMPHVDKYPGSLLQHVIHHDNRHKFKFSLFMALPTPQPRRPRRMLKKRTPKDGDNRRRKRNRRNRHAEATSSFGTILPGIITNPDDTTNISSNENNSIQNKLVAAVRQEYRPLVPSVRRDMGEDYWIDPEDLERDQRRREEKEKQRVFLGNRTQKEKLMTEVKAPYRQNWIGYFSLMVAVLSIIVSQFPELLEPTPLTRFPDL